MAVDYTTTALVASAKRRGFIPSGSGLSTSDILQILSEELRNYIPAFLKGIREEYLIAQLEIAVTSPIVAAPRRAVGAAFRGVGWQSDAATYPRPLTRIEPERQPGYPMTAGEPVGYLLRGNNLILVPGVSSGTLVLSYQQRPGQLVRTDACGLITAVDTGAEEVTVAASPDDFVTGDAFDVVSSQPNFVALGLDVVGTTGTPNVWALSPFPESVAVGDYLCLAGETPIPQIPTEVHDLLAQAGALKIAQACGSSRLDAVGQGLRDLREQLTVILSPRDDGSARTIISKSRLGGGW